MRQVNVLVEKLVVEALEELHGAGSGERGGAPLVSLIGQSELN